MDEQVECFNDAISKAASLLPVEKKQIVDAFNEGYRQGELLEDSIKGSGDISEFSDADNYYTQKFTQ